MRAPAGPVVGRSAEIGIVATLLDDAREGRGRCLLVSGEAGVGKTSLVREIWARHRDDVVLLWATCLPLSTVTLPLAPLEDAVRRRVVGSDEPGSLPAPGEGVDWTRAFDEWLINLGRSRPVLLVVDDLQWADQSTLDVLTYVLAGLDGRRLLLLGTSRDPARGKVRSLRAWLANARRLPGVGELRLDRLDRVSTGEQVAGVLGTAAADSLSEAVYSRTLGNPYLTQLLLRELRPDTQTLPERLPAALDDALRAAGDDMGHPARELCSLIAIAGEPTDHDLLVKACVEAGLTADMEAALREAADAAILGTEPGDTFWFVHPLLAELFEADLRPNERRAYHRAWIRVLDCGSGPSGMARVAALARHHHAVGDAPAAYAWSVRAAEEALAVGGFPEALRAYRTALELWPQLPDSGGGDRLGLLARARQAAEAGYDLAAELGLVEELLGGLDPAQDPVPVSRLLRRQVYLRHVTGRRGSRDVDVLREACALSLVEPEEHALSLAALALAEIWLREPDGVTHAEEACDLARTVGSASVMGRALLSRAVTRMETGRLDDAGADVSSAYRLAVEARDGKLVDLAASWEFNVLAGLGRDHDALRAIQRGLDDLERFRVPRRGQAWLAAIAASHLLELGDSRRCRDLLREALGSPDGGLGSIQLRLTAALVASRQGRTDEAVDHLARAEELVTAEDTYRGLSFGITRAEVAFACRDPRGAHHIAVGVLRGVLDHCWERLPFLAARAVGDLLQQARDRSDERLVRHWLGTLDDLDRTRSALPSPGDDFAQASPRLMEAAFALYDAEAARCRADPYAAKAWRQAVDVCASASQRWDEAYARWRLAEALLADAPSRREGAGELRRARALAAELCAEPWLREIEALAVMARVRLDEVTAALPAQRLPSPLDTLTTREREVLAHLQAGRTYAEIAAELFISEKTVSVHVSNILRKTGTSTRVEAAALARRVLGEADTTA